MACVDIVCLIGLMMGIVFYLCDHNYAEINNNSNENRISNNKLLPFSVNLML